LFRASLKLAVPTTAVLLLLMANEALAEGHDRVWFPPPGQVVDIGHGQLMHVRVWGSDAPGRPSLLLLAGAAIPSSAWGWIGPALSRDYRVVAIDRPGIGWSTGGQGPRTAQVAADAIATALDKVGIRPPYVVIAHSFAGFTGRVFMGDHRDEIQAAVMLDTSTPEAPGAGYGYFYRVAALRQHLGLEYIFPPANDYASLPRADAAAAYSVSRWTTHRDGAADELDAWSVSADETLAAGTFGALPVLVVTTTGSNASQLEWQHLVASISSASRFVVLNVGHTQMLTEPDQAAMVIDEIRGFLGRTLPAP